MSDRISLTGISATGFHGVFPEERRDGQIFIVDLELSLDLKLAGESDDLTKTINYASVATLVVEEITSEPLSLIEALAHRISKRVLGEFPQIDSILVTVHKPDAPVGVNFKDISVTIERSK
jgi:dihydroneopterin aldolase/2-amino-4-hydroxy-6-hydroxymethyldihydropteridine diphosphokinase